mgnify:CR=1 FL=1
MLLDKVGAKARSGARPTLRVYVSGFNFTVTLVDNSELLDKVGEGLVGDRLGLIDFS